MSNARPGGDQFSVKTAETRERDKYILGSPPRLSPLQPEERSDTQRQLIEKMATPSYVVRDKGLKDDKEWIEILARHPELFVAHLEMTTQFFARGELSARDRELVVLRTGWLCQAPFEWGGHVPIGKACGISAEEIARLIDGSSARGWSKHDRALVRAAEELHFDSMISDDTWTDLAETLNDKQLIELVMVIGHYKTVAYYQNSLRFRLPEGNMGLAAR